jgi:hypothetical protein
MSVFSSCRAATSRNWVYYGLWAVFLALATSELDFSFYQQQTDEQAGFNLAIWAPKLG